MQGTDKTLISANTFDVSIREGMVWVTLRAVTQGSSTWEVIRVYLHTSITNKMYLPTS